MDLKGLIEGWNGLSVVVRFDRPSSTWIFIALHDATLGRPTGGTRLRLYRSPEEGLRDALHLAEGMTHKWAAAGLPFGGGKAVLAVPRSFEGEERKALLRRYGRLVDSLHGGFSTGEDLGTTPEDMAIIGEETPHVMGGGPAGGAAVDPGPFTSRGVLAAMRTAVRRACDGNGLVGRTVLIQGVGDVGAPLARQLAAADARVLLSDLDPSRLEGLHSELAAAGHTVEKVDPTQVYDTPCDVFAPCAVGFVLNRDTVPRLRCQVVCGSANNQLAEPEAAELLHRRGILYAPDYVANGGGAIAFGLMELGETAEDVLVSRVERIGDALEEIFAEAAERDESPLAASRRRVERILAAGKV